jgi:sterol desaturase/sphingolipid hydroxylase (fatty acid hydroxylase superfamily)
MNVRNLLENLTTMLVLMAAAAVIEVFLPLFEREESGKGRAKANLSLMVVSLGFNWLLTSATAIIALSLKPAGILAMLKLPFAVQVLVTVLVLDFMYGYTSHVLLHKIPMMWRVHRVHHSDPFVDVTTSLRQHPIEVLWRFIFMTIPAWTTRAAHGGNRHLPAGFEGKRRSVTRQYPALASTRSSRFPHLVHAEYA